MDKIIPITLSDDGGKIYGGFWRRISANFVDMIILMIVSPIFYFINKLDKTAMFYTFIPSLAISFYYQIYLVKLWGATPGKKLLKLRILKKDGQKAEWKEAILRHAVDYSIYILFSIASLAAVMRIDNQEYLSLSYMQLGAKIMLFMPAWGMALSRIMSIWTYSEFIVLLFNKRKRALHDFIAGTVVVKEKYLPAIEKYLQEDAQSSEYAINYGRSTGTEAGSQVME